MKTDLSFVLTAGLSLLSSSLIQLICDRLHIQALRPFFEALVTSFSDQQLIRGLSLSIATLYTPTACQIDAYRYNILCYLILMTIVSHLSSILVLKSYVRGELLLEMLRGGLVLAQVLAGLLLSARETTSFPTGIPSPENIMNTTLVLPAVCFQRENVKPYQGFQNIPHAGHRDIATFSSYVIIVVFYAITAIYAAAHILTHTFAQGTRWEVRQREENAKQWDWFWWLGLARGMILLGAWIIWIGAVVKLYKLRGWMMGSGWMSQKSHMGDNNWSFGQLLSMSILGAAVLSFFGAWNGESSRYEEFFSKANDDEKTSNRIEMTKKAESCQRSFRIHQSMSMLRCNIHVVTRTTLDIPVEAQGDNIKVKRCQVTDISCPNLTLVIILDPSRGQHPSFNHAYLLQ